MKKLEYSCGLGSVRPAWMQRFANTKCFMVVYSLLDSTPRSPADVDEGVHYAVPYSALGMARNVVIADAPDDHVGAGLRPTEKPLRKPADTAWLQGAHSPTREHNSLRLGGLDGEGPGPKVGQQAPQREGILMSGNEVSQVFLSLAMSYHGGRGNRPLWISWGVTFSAISCFILALPHLVYGPGKDAIALTEEFLDTTVLNSSIPKTNDRALLCSGNRTASAYCQEDVSGGEHSLMPLILIFFSQFVLGIGTTLFHSLGQTYLDDHTKKTNAPLLLGMVLSLRMLGPAAGFAFSSFCLSLYIDPTLTPVIKPTDPRWLGALVVGLWGLPGSVTYFPTSVEPSWFDHILPNVYGALLRLWGPPGFVTYFPASMGPSWFDHILPSVYGALLVLSHTSQRLWGPPGLITYFPASMGPSWFCHILPSVYGALLLANALVVLSSTAEDGEIEVRISVGLNEGKATLTLEAQHAIKSLLYQPYCCQEAWRRNSLCNSPPKDDLRNVSEDETCIGRRLTGTPPTYTHS
uniref:Uncharacterized protein n=1 Tax=Timema shepardi TaxID=629360 RepID=A0A7R9AUF3_TIMSH|nr:unnamed protein product [Timema shepardi]